MVSVSFTLVLCTLASNPDLDAARKQLASLKYAQAAKSLDRVATAEALTRDEVLELFELTGVVHASLGHEVPAQEAFERLLALEPDWRLQGRPAPRITTPFFEARSKQKPAGLTRLVLLPGAGDDGQVTLSVEDPHELLVDVAVDVVEDGAPRSVVVPVEPVLRVPVHGRQVSVKAVGRGARGWVLTPPVSQSLTLTPPPPPPPPPQPTKPPAVAPPALVSSSAPREEPRPHNRPPLLVTSAVLGVVGAVAAGLGVMWTVQYSQQKNAFDALFISQADGTELATKTYRQVADQQAAVNTTAGLANGSLVVGGALLVTATVFLAIGLRPPPVALVPTPGGAGLFAQLELP